MNIQYSALNVTVHPKISINFLQRPKFSYSHTHTQTLRSYPVIKVLYPRPLLTLIPSINPVVSEISQISTHATARMAPSHARIQPIALTFQPVTSPLITCKMQCQSCQSLGAVIRRLLCWCYFKNRPMINTGSVLQHYATTHLVQLVGTCIHTENVYGGVCLDECRRQLFKCTSLFKSILEVQFIQRSILLCCTFLNQSVQYQKDIIEETHNCNVSQQVKMSDKLTGLIHLIVCIQKKNITWCDSPNAQYFV